MLAEDTYPIHTAFAQSQVFEGLPYAELADIAARFNSCEFKRGERLFHEGDPAHTFRRSSFIKERADEH